MNWYQSGIEEAEEILRYYREFGDGKPEETRDLAVLEFEILFNDLARELGIRDTWERASFYDIYSFTAAIIRSKKTGVEFRLGVSLFGWFIEGPIANAAHIRFTKDDFWEHIAKISSCGKAELVENGDIPSGGWSYEAARKVNQHKGSLVFSIARDYLMCALAEDRWYNLHTISVTLNFETPETEVRSSIKTALQSLYRINYLLYRSAELERRRANKKNGWSL